MKKIEALIRPLRLEQVTDALDKVGVKVFTVTELKGFGEVPQQAEISKETQYVIDFLPKVKIEIVLPDDKIDIVVAAIKEAAFTSQPSDGNILVLNVEKFVMFSPE